MRVRAAARALLAAPLAPRRGGARALRHAHPDWLPLPAGELRANERGGSRPARGGGAATVGGLNVGARGHDSAARAGAAGRRLRLPPGLAHLLPHLRRPLDARLLPRQAHGVLAFHYWVYFIMMGVALIVGVDVSIL
ncbi:hypothetical protein SEVIR_4G072133v4 [Setaria viridis]